MSEYNHVSLNGQAKPSYWASDGLDLITWGTLVFDAAAEAAHIEEIREAQRVDVEEAWIRLGDAEAVSLDLWLDLWIVRRRLHELGLGEFTPYPPAACSNSGKVAPFRKGTGTSR